MFVAGALVAFQPSVNARLAQKVGLVESAWISFAVGTVFLLLMVLSFGQGSLRAITRVSWWELTGGLMGAFYVFTVIFFVPRLGTGAAMAVTIAGQMITALLLDHFQLFGFRGIPVDIFRVLGAGLILVGTWLMIRL